ncbi:putative endoribonuclease L-PSP [Mortierella sp. GBAus27b]|nr:hypothetical protein BGX31_007733 [Mortierella sp. GBA43]KAI8350034.1 putative endoribonuclease L-PSP [Mortierella sp. GBAus27b]
MATVHEIISTTKAPGAVGPYSQAVVANGFIFCSGSVGVDPETKKVVDGGVEAQAHQVFSNLTAILTEAGTSFAHAVKVNVYLKDMNDFAKVNAVYAERLGGALPARACVEVARLPLDVLVEIDVIATV